MLALAKANLLRHRGRTTLSALGIAFGVSTVVALLGLTGGLNRSADGLAHLGRAGFGVFQAGLADLTASSLPLQSLRRVRNVQGVAAATPVQIVAGALASEPSTLTFGAETESFLAHRLVLLAGRRFGPQEAMAGAGAASALHLHAGQTIVLDGRSFRLSGIFSSGIPLEDSGLVIPLPAAQALTGRSETISMIAVLIAPGYGESPLRREVQAAVPGAAAIGAPGELARVDTNSRIISEAGVIVTVLALLLGGVIVIDTTALAMIEREGELGILRSIGWTGGQIIALLFSESFTVSAIGALGGLLIGWAAAALLVKALSIAVFVTPQVTFWVLLRGLLIGLGFGALSALFATWRILRVPLGTALGRA